MDPVSGISEARQSPNTIKAYAHVLKDWFSFLALRGLDWRTATLEDVASFVAWLRLPPATREGTVTVLPTVAHHRQHQGPERFPHAVRDQVPRSR